jgi:hypothetical protein
MKKQKPRKKSHKKKVIKIIPERENCLCPYCETLLIEENGCHRCRICGFKRGGN